MMTISLKIRRGVTPAQNALINAIAAVPAGQVLARTATGVDGAGTDVTAANLQELASGEETELHSHPHPCFIGTEENPTGIPVGGIYFQYE